MSESPWINHESSRDDVRLAFDACKSPVERDFLTAILEEMSVDHWVRANVVVRDTNSEEEPSPILGVMDFVVGAGYYDIRVGVEIDGHEFHEKTKDQARKDKRRERALLADPFGPVAIIRFTGSEVYASPGTCAKECLNIIATTTWRFRSAIELRLKSQAAE